MRRPRLGSSSQIWDANASEYDAIRSVDSIYQSCVDRAVEELSRGLKRGTVLDAGSGTGHATRELTSRFERVVAVDFSGGALNVLCSKEALRRVSAVRADIRRLPFADATFDAVLCANTLQHLAPGGDQRAAAAELRRVAKPGAVIVVTVHHYSHAKQRGGWIKEGAPGQKDVDYIYRFTSKELVALMPGAVVSAMGFRLLSRVPRVGRALQNAYSRCVGRIAAALGQGHMLLARVQNEVC